MTCSAPGNGWPPLPIWMSGPAPTPCRRGGDHPHPPAHQPDQDHPGRPHPTGTSRDRPGRSRRAAPPRHQPRHAPHPPAALPGIVTGAQRDQRRPAARLADGRRADSARRRQRVIAAINRAVTDGTEISVSAIARAAAVDRTFLYRHRDLLGKIHATQAGPPGDGGAGPAVTRASLQADLLAAHERAIRLAARVQQLEKRLSETLGDQAWRESGLGAPADIDTLTPDHHLEQQAIDLQLQLEERDEELAASRAANRELMAQLNAAHR